jgi:hypothetical protein
MSDADVPSLLVDKKVASAVETVGEQQLWSDDYQELGMVGVAMEKRV